MGLTSKNNIICLHEGFESDRWKTLPDNCYDLFAKGNKLNWKSPTQGKILSAMSKLEWISAGIRLKWKYKTNTDKREPRSVYKRERQTSREEEKKKRKEEGKQESMESGKRDKNFSITRFLNFLRQCSPNIWNFQGCSLSSQPFTLIL